MQMFFVVFFFLIPARKDLKFTSDSCVTLSLGQLPSPTALRVSMRVSAALCVLYGRLCRLFFWEGSPWDFESGLTSGMQWSGTHYLAELKLPLLSLLIVPRQNIWVEALSHSKVRLTSASHVFVDCAPCFNLITRVIIYIYICVYFCPCPAGSLRLRGHAAGCDWSRTATWKLTFPSLSAHLCHQQDWEDEVQDLRGTARIPAMLWLKVHHPFIQFVRQL